MKNFRKNTIRGRFAPLLPSLALLAAMAAGCAAPEVADTWITGDADGLHLRLSIETDAYTRAGTAADEETMAAERRIDNVLVMLFAADTDGNPGALLMSKTAENLTDDAGEGMSRRFDVKMPLSSRTDFPDRFRVMAIANGERFAGEVSEMQGKAYSEIRASIWRDEKGGDGDPLFTMWGCAGEIVNKGPQTQNVSMRMMRDMAKVTVALPFDKDGNSAVDGDNGFKLACALVYNRRGEVSVLPDMSRLDSPYGLGEGRDPYGLRTPTVKKDADGHTLQTNLSKEEGYEDALSTTGLNSISIYVPEQDILMGAGASVDDGNAMKRPALIVGGYYGGDTDTPTWYRVDFTGDIDMGGNPKLTDILRNHHYRVSVKAVYGPGEDTPELAYGTLQTKVEASVMDWSETEWDAEIDGANWIAAQREVSVGASAGDSVEVMLRSNVSSDSWTFSWDEDSKGLFEATIQSDQAEQADESDESDQADESGQSGQSDRIKVIIRALEDLPADMESRSAVLTVNVTPRLRFVINVIQTRKSGDGDGDSDSNHDVWGDEYLQWIL